MWMYDLNATVYCDTKLTDYLLMCALFRSLQHLVAKYALTGDVTDFPCQPRKSKLNSRQEKFIDDCLAKNDELTAYKLKELLCKKWPGSKAVSIATMKTARRRLGWVATTPRHVTGSAKTRHNSAFFKFHFIAFS